MPLPEGMGILFEMPYLIVMLVLFVLIILGITLTVIWIRRRVMWMVIATLLILALNSFLGSWVLPLLTVIKNESVHDMTLIMLSSFSSQVMSLISQGILWLFTVRVQSGKKI